MRDNSDRKKQNGFSYVEVVIGLTILLIGILARVSALSANLIRSYEAEKRILAKQHGLSTIESIISARDIARSGVIDSWNSVQNISETNPSGIFVTAFHPIREDLGWDGVAGTIGTQPQVTTIQTKNGQANEVKPYDLLMLENGSSQVLFMPTANADANNFRVAPGDPLGLNESYNGGINSTILTKCTAIRTEKCIDYPANAKKIIWVSYLLRADGTLIRRVYGNNTGNLADEQIREQPIAYNISDMQFKYVLKDGTVSENPEDLNKIRQITVTFKVVSTERDEQTGKFDVITLTATFSTRNLQYDVG